MELNCEQEVKNRINWIRQVIASTHTNGVVFGNSGGKDCALVGILCKLAQVPTLSVIMPCESTRNYTTDTLHANLLNAQFDIESITVDITPIKKAATTSLSCIDTTNPLTLANINPRLRMTVLYAVASSKNYLVAGTGNKSEITMGYFTKFGDGGCDFNPIADLTVTQVYQMLRYLHCPQPIIDKAPSAALWDNQTDEQEMGASYASIDQYIDTGCGEAKSIVDAAYAKTSHKRRMPLTYPQQID